jgi:hypothetical protein
MATRAIIAVERAQGWRGRYAHWDNYPERMVGVLGALVERDGITKVVTTLINDNASWSVIDYEQGDTDPFGDSQNIRKGYGVTHDDIDKDSDMAWYTEETGAYSWAEYVYVMRRNGVSVYKVESGNPEPLTHLACHTWEEAKRQAGIGV